MEVSSYVVQLKVSRDETKKAKGELEKLERSMKDQMQQIEKLCRRQNLPDTIITAAADQNADFYSVFGVAVSEYKRACEDTDGVRREIETLKAAMETYKAETLQEPGYPVVWGQAAESGQNRRRDRYGKGNPAAGNRQDRGSESLAA